MKVTNTTKFVHMFDHRPAIHEVFDVIADAKETAPLLTVRTLVFDRAKDGGASLILIGEEELGNE